MFSMKNIKSTAGFLPHAAVVQGLFVILFSAFGTIEYPELVSTPNTNSNKAYLWVCDCEHVKIQVC